MKRVLKFTVPVGDSAFIDSGPVVHVESQKDFESVQVWIEVPADDEPNESREVAIFATGQPIPNEWRHVGSTVPFTAHGSLVWHVYEKVKA